MSQMEPDKFENAIRSIAGTTWQGASKQKEQVKRAIVDKYRHRYNNSSFSGRRLLVLVIVVVAISGTSIAGVLALQKILEVSATGPMINAEILVPEGEIAKLTIVDSNGTESSVSIDAQGKTHTTGDLESISVNVKKVA